MSSIKRALRIGFEEIELHMAHGYLAHSFMSPISNKRTDQYGGSFENRMRFPLSIAKAARAVVPKGMPLGARITGSDWREGGLTPDDAVAMAKALKAEGADFICVSSGGITADTRNPSEPGYNVAIAARVKKEAGIATRAVGLILKPSRPKPLSPTARPTWSPLRASSSTTHIGAGTPPRRSAPKWRGRCSMPASVPSCGRRPPPRRDADRRLLRHARGLTRASIFS